MGHPRLPWEKGDEGAGIVTLSGDFVRTVRTSAVATMLACRPQCHQSIMVEDSHRPEVDGAVNSVAIRLNSAGNGLHEFHPYALGRISHILQSRVAAFSCINIPWGFAIGFAVIFDLSFLFKKTNLALAVPLGDIEINYSDGDCRGWSKCRYIS